MNLRASFGDPHGQRLRDHLRAIVAADVLREAVQAHGLSRGLDHADAVDAPGHIQRETNLAVFVDQR